MMTEDHKAARAIAASSILGGMYAANVTDDYEDPVGHALGQADELLARIDRTTWSRPKDSRNDLQRETQRQNIEDGVAARRDAADSASGADDGKGYPALRDLGVSGRACAPLERMDIETIEDLSGYRREAIEEVKGVSRDTMKMLDKLLPEHDLNWLGDEDFSDNDDGDGEDPEDVL